MAQVWVLVETFVAQAARFENGVPELTASFKVGHRAGTAESRAVAEAGAPLTALVVMAAFAGATRMAAKAIETKIALIVFIFCSAGFFTLFTTP